MQPILYIHRKALRSIKLYGLQKSGFDGFDLREFENLEKLSLASDFSGRQLFNRNKSCEPPDSLLAPRLCVFHWDLTLLDQQCGESLRDFGQAEEDWLRLLARKAIKHGCPLQRIEITFNPVVDQYISITDKVYPWDRMDAMGADLRPHGIEVSYNTPSVSRGRYSMLLKRAAEDNPKLATEVEWIGSILQAKTPLPMTWREIKNILLRRDLGSKCIRWSK